MTTESEGLDVDDLFREPEGYYQAEKAATFLQYELPSGYQFKLRLVGHNPLWGHLLWNAGRVVTDYLDANQEKFVRHRNILELGAGAGLPSLACLHLGARQVVVTDYPDPDLIDNLHYNIQQNFSTNAVSSIAAVGYLWGTPVRSLTSYLDNPNDGFDLLILADILFNHSEHEKLVTSVSQTLKRASSSRALVFFTPYRPWLLSKDLHFFELATEAGLLVEKIVEKVMDRVMFDKDLGDELLRRTVYGYELRWKL